MFILILFLTGRCVIHITLIATASEFLAQEVDWSLQLLGKLGISIHTGSIQYLFC